MRVNIIYHDVAPKRRSYDEAVGTFSMPKGSAGPVERRPNPAVQFGGLKTLAQRLQRLEYAVGILRDEKDPDAQEYRRANGVFPSVARNRASDARAAPCCSKCADAAPGKALWSMPEIPPPDSDEFAEMIAGLDGRIAAMEEAVAQYCMRQPAPDPDRERDRKLHPVVDAKALALRERKQRAASGRQIARINARNRAFYQRTN